MAKDEIWRDVKGFEGRYQVSNKGNIFSVDRIVRGKKWGGRTLKPIHDKNGYLTVALYENGVGKNKKIHRLVSEAFLPNPNNYLEINHIDENKTNNHVENLEWCTREHNINHGKRTEKVSKRVRAINIKTGEVITFSSTSEAGRKGYHQGSVAAACRGVYNTGGGNLYRGYRWYYEEGE